MTAPVLTRLDDGLVRITLARPEAGNAVTPDTIAALDAAVDVAQRSDTRAVLLEAQGRNFCVGADLRHLGGGTDLPGELDTMATAFHAMLLRLASLRIPVVAAVQGNAVGAGFGLALAADLVVAASDARFATGYAKLGLSADAGVSLFLTKTLGPRLARSLLISARTLDAGQAERLGLVDSVVVDADLETEAIRLATTLAAGPTEAFAAIKRIVAAAESEDDLARHLALEQQEIVALARSDFAGRAIAAVLKR